MKSSLSCLVCLYTLFAVIPTAFGIYCYQCNSNEDTYCSEAFNKDGLIIEPSVCDGIHEAKYCIKATGMYEGTIGTRRFCSSRHHGNYCEYIKRPGDEREYRSCVYTCYNDSCNSSSKFSKSTILSISCLLCSIFVWYVFRH